MSIIRDKKNPYIMVEKEIILSPNLSWAAKGLYCYLEIVIECHQWDKFPKELMDELVNYGYLKRSEGGVK